MSKKELDDLLQVLRRGYIDNSASNHPDMKATYPGLKLTFKILGPNLGFIVRNCNKCEQEIDKQQLYVNFICIYCGSFFDVCEKCQRDSRLFEDLGMIELSIITHTHAKMKFDSCPKGCQ